MAPGALQEALTQALDKRREAGRLPEMPNPVAEANAIDFGSNDILSISCSILRDELCRELRDYPDFHVGSRGSRVLGGTGQYLVDLEAHLAQFHKAKDALFFNSGFNANVAIWATLPQPGDVIVYDEFIHASIRDGMKLSRARNQQAFRHSDASSFQSVLRAIKQDDVNHDITQGRRSVLVALETVYSMDGDVCPLQLLLQTAQEVLPDADVVFVVDEAHSNGILGPQGSGLVVQYGLEEQVAIRVLTFGKALGSTGGVVLCDPVVKAALFSFARNFVYTTGPTFMDLAAVRVAYRLIEGAEFQLRRERLQDLVSYFYDRLQNHPLWKDLQRTGKLRVVDKTMWQDVRVPIIPLITRPGESRRLANHLLRHNFLTHSVQYPLVPPDAERIRIMMHADNTREQIEQLIDAVMHWSRQSEHGCLAKAQDRSDA